MAESNNQSVDRLAVIQRHLKKGNRQTMVLNIAVVVS